MAKRRIHQVLSAVTLAACGSVDSELPGQTAQPTQPSAAPTLHTLSPGGTVQLRQDVNVNVVLIGLRGRVDVNALRARLAPMNGVAQARDDGSLYLGQRFDFRYNVVETPQSFDDALFGLLRQAAVPQAPIPFIPGLPPITTTPPQWYYTYCNIHPSVGLPPLACSLDPSLPRVNARAITENFMIDAAGVEVLLSHWLGALGVDVRQPTAVILNWYGRPDYIDHIYLNTDEPDHDTGTPWGFYVSNAMAGTGGTPSNDPESCRTRPCLPHRLWFHDLSAGPFDRTANWELTLRTFTPGQAASAPTDYRIPHTADYDARRPGAYRVFDTLTEDIADRLVNDVFLSGIAFGGPIYPADLASPRLPRSIALDVHRWNFDPVNPSPSFDLANAATRLSAFPYTFTTSLRAEPETQESLLGRQLGCFIDEGWYGLEPERWCMGRRPFYSPLASLYAYFSGPGQHHYRNPISADYRLPLFDFQLGPDRFAHFSAADSNHPPGADFYVADHPGLRQSFVYMFYTWERRMYSGRGLAIVHEAGHHLSLSHPFNGYRCHDAACSRRTLFLGAGDTRYSQVGNYTGGLMTYVNVTSDPSVFERESVLRNVSWEHLATANSILERVLASPRAHEVTARLEAADRDARAGMEAFAASDYAGAHALTRRAYEGVLAAADAIHVNLQAEGVRRRRRHPADHHADFASLVRLATDDREMHGGGPTLPLPAGATRDLFFSPVTLGPR